MNDVFGIKRWTAIEVDASAAALWEIYSDSVGGVNFKGDPLPSWEEFSRDPEKRTQSDGYRAMARHALGNPVAMRQAVITTAVEVLNRAFAADPNAIHALICNRVPCNTVLMEDPTIVVESPRPINEEDERATFFQVGTLGLLNGILGELTGGLAVATQFGDKDEEGFKKLLGFQAWDPNPREDDD